MKEKKLNCSNGCACHADSKAICHKDRDTMEYFLLWLRLGFAMAMLVGGILFKALGDSTIATVVSYALYALSYVLAGYPVVVNTVKNLRRGRIFDENFLMLAASVGAFALQLFWEGVLVVLLYQIGEALQEIAVGVSKKSISELMKLKSDRATRVSENTYESVSPEELKVGDIVLVAAGEKVPCDCRLLSEKAHLDMKALTGESGIMDKITEEEILSGSANAGEAFLACVIRTYEDSAVAKVLEIVEAAVSKKAPAEKFITKFAKIYTPIVCILALCIALFPPILTGIIDGSYRFVNGAHWIQSALTFLVISCPCALVISVPLTYFSGIGGAAQKGVLVKSAAALDTLAGVRIAALDKTGTLTKGNFSLIGVYPKGASADEVKRICAALEAYSKHPISTAFQGVTIEERAQDVVEIVGKGLKGIYCGKSAVFGTRAFLYEEGYDVDEKLSADTVLYLVYDEKYCGCVEIGDMIRPESKSVLEQLQQMNVRPVMVTGDSPARAQNVANNIGMSAFKAGLLPHQKVEYIRELQTRGKVMYAGDGINDAPVLLEADCSVAMGSLGSAAAVEAADFVLISDSVTAIPRLIKGARKTKRLALQNIVFSVAMKVVFLVLGVFPWFPVWLAVFADVGIMLLAALNGLRARR